MESWQASGLYLPSSGSFRKREATLATRMVLD